MNFFRKIQQGTEEQRKRAAWILAIICGLIIIIVWATLTPKTIFKKENKKSAITFGQIFDEMKQEMSDYNMADLKKIVDKYNKQKTKTDLRADETEYPEQPHLPLEK